MTRQEAEDLLRRGNEAYARLREDPEAWAEVLRERAEWDCTLMDGLEDEPPWPKAELEADGEGDAASGDDERRPPPPSPPLP